MYQLTEAPASAPALSPLLAGTIGVAAFGTVAAGVYPALLIDAADVSARALGALSAVAVIR